MFVRSITICNFGPFSGAHTLALKSCSDSGFGDRPITLIGGINGSGKTSFLEAIRICLHGRRALGNPRLSDYLDHIGKRMHEDIRGVASGHAYVELNIVVVQNGTEKEYSINRAWDITDDNVKEHLSISEDNAALGELYADQYQSFLDELIPLGLAEFFFFDGERIQKLAEDDGSDALIADAIKNLLGLDVVSKLETDLSVFLRGKLSNEPTIDVQEEFQDVNQKLSQEISRIEQLEAEDNSLNQICDSIETRIKLQESRISSEGGDFAKNRENIRSELTTWENVLEQCKVELTELSTEVMPFSLVPELARGLEQRINEESNVRKNAIASEVLLDKQQLILKKLDDPAQFSQLAKYGVPYVLRKQITKLMKMVVSPILEPTEDKQSKPLHDISESDQILILEGISEALTEVPARAAEISAKGEQAYSNIRRLQRDLDRAPEDDVLGPLLVELGDLHKELSQVRQDKIRITDELSVCLNNKGDFERQLNKISESIDDSSNHGRVVALASKVRHVLESYNVELTVGRVERLGESVTECYKLLTHKQSLCDEIRFDQDNLSLKLYDANGNLVYRPLLSAGEKQILAISILWGIGKATSRDMPVIIDTPLARLDEEHRRRLLTYYFPHASNQVIILSTNSEINDAEYKLLNPAISEAYHFVYNQVEKETTIHSGYLQYSEAVTVEN